MALAAIPSNLTVQVANGQCYLLFSAVPGATSYQVQRSTDGVTFSNPTSVLVPAYLDTAVVAGTQYFYRIASVNSSGASPSSSVVSAIPALAGQASLQQVRTWAQQRADRVNSNFVSLPEWNDYIRSSCDELYDLLVTTYEEYFVKTPYTFTTDGVSQSFALPADFYKLVGVDLSVGNANNAKVTLNKFNFIERNKYVYPQLASSLLGLFAPEYRLVANNIQLIPTPSSGQTVSLWYIPRMVKPLQETDLVDGVSGWLEYVIVDAAIKALQKEEQDVQVLMMQKQALIKRIEESAMNRDAGQPDTISKTRKSSRQFSGGY